MKAKLLLPFFALSLLLFSTAFSLGNKTIKIQTSAVCEMCKDLIESSLGALEGVNFVELDLTTKKVKIKYDDSVQSEASLRLALSKIGYSADEVPADKAAFEELPGCCKSAKACVSGQKEATGKSCH
jgi:Copper chaperone